MKKYLYIPNILIQTIQDKVSPKYQNHYLYIIHKLSWYNLNCKDYYEESGVKIHHNNVATELNISFSSMTLILSNLIEWNIIKRVSGYEMGKYACSYKLHNSYESLPVIRYQISSKQSPFIKSVLGREKPTTRIERQTLSILKNKVSISSDGIEFIKSKYPDIDNQIVDIDPRDIGLLSFYFKDFYAKRPEKTKNRLFTNLTSLKTEYKKYVLLNNKPLIQTDLVNSQVLFGAVVLDKYFSEFLEDDFSLFKELSISGNIYEYLAVKSGFIEAGNCLSGHSRKEFKQLFFKDIWYSKISERKTKVKQAFIDSFPSVYKVITEIKRDDYTAWPVYLQEAEAETFVDKVAKVLIGEGIDCLSIHDSILVSDAGKLPRVVELIKEVFQLEYKILPHFKSE